jgi:hypothetical protein
MKRLRADFLKTGAADFWSVDCDTSRGGKEMRREGFILAVVLACMTAGACAHDVRVYDPYRSDYHVWDAHERGYYDRWSHDTHHDSDYKKLNADDQKQYWNWRHQQPDAH